MDEVSGLAALAAKTESVELPDGDDERFAGYGVMGLPFASGHVLAMRRFPASSIGPAYTSVWHRAPTGEWTFWQDQPIQLGCGRYFSADVSTITEAEISVQWPSAYEMTVAIADADLRWHSTMHSNWMTKAFNSLGAAMPDRAWRSEGLLRVMGPVAGRLLGTGPVRLAGRVPNGQSFVANPQRIWYVAEARATLGNVDLGPRGPLAVQAMLGDFAIPQKGVFALGRAFFR